MERRRIKKKIRNTIKIVLFMVEMILSIVGIYSLMMFLNVLFG